MNDNELKHYGILGMRWGVRRGSNSSGGSGRSSSKKRSIKTSDDFNKIVKLKKKRVEEMSNEEISAVIKRMDLQRRYKDLNPSRADKGRKAVKDTISGIGKVAGVAGSIAALAAVGNAFYKKVAPKVASMVDSHLDTAIKGIRIGG